QDALHRALGAIEKSLHRLVSKALLASHDVDNISKRISHSADPITAADADVVIEAIYENEAAKVEAWRRLDTICKPTALFASNTSSISITRLSSAVKAPERFIGMHFFNPVPIMKLVELIRGNRTSDATVQRATELAKM